MWLLLFIFLGRSISSLSSEHQNNIGDGIKFFDSDKCVEDGSCPDVDENLCVKQPKVKVDFKTLLWQIYK